MAHRTSAAALHAARTVLREYDIAIRPDRQMPNQAADEKCLAIVIDLTTNAYRVCGVRPELRYWQDRMHAGTATPQQIGGFFNAVLEAFESVPVFRDSEQGKTEPLEPPRSLGGQPIPRSSVPRGFFAKPPTLRISRFAADASGMVFHHYVVTPKKAKFARAEDGDVPDRTRVAALIDMGLGLARAMSEALPPLKRCKRDLRDGKATATDVARCLRHVGVVLEYLPNYENREEEVKLLC